MTGASTGMGAATARELARRGYHVLAGVRTDRDAAALRAPDTSRNADRPARPRIGAGPHVAAQHNPGRPGPVGTVQHDTGTHSAGRPGAAGTHQHDTDTGTRSSGLEPVILDITNPDHIAALAARVDGDPLRRPLRALVNNAGIPGAGPVELVPLDEWRRIFEVNLFGHVAVTQALLPALVRSKGRVVNITSMSGKLSMAGYGPYASSKFAMEAMSDALRNELAPDGVQVVVVEPGGVKTEMAGHGTAGLRGLADRMTPAQNVRYGPLMQAIPSHVAAFTEAGVTSDVAARTIARAVTGRRPRTRYTIGSAAAFLIGVSRFLPDRLLDRITTRDLRKHYPAA